MVVVVEKKVVRLKVETQVTFGKLSASKTAVRDVRAADAGDRHQLKITIIILSRPSSMIALSCHQLTPKTWLWLLKDTNSGLVVMIDNDVRIGVQESVGDNLVTAWQQFTDILESFDIWLVVMMVL